MNISFDSLEAMYAKEQEDHRPNLERNDAEGSFARSHAVAMAFRHFYLGETKRKMEPRITEGSALTIIGNMLATMCLSEINQVIGSKAILDLMLQTIRLQALHEIEIAHGITIDVRQ